MTNLFFSTVLLTLPDCVLLLMVSIILLMTTTKIAAVKLNTLVYWTTQLTLVSACLLTLPLLHSQTATLLLLHGQYVVDPLALLSKCSIYLLSLFIFAYSHHALRIRLVPSEYYVLGLLAVFGLSLMASAASLLMIYLGLELFSLTLYAMIALEKNAPDAIEAAMKYFVLGSLASGLLLYGMSLLYGLTGSIQLHAIASLLTMQPNAVLLVALVFIVSGLLFKFGAFPFHAWVPDVYEGAMTATVLLIASVPKIAALVVTIRLLAEALPSMHMTWQPILIAASILSMCFGNLLAMVQTNIKRLLAYSSIAHVGYLLLGVIAGASLAEGYQAALFYTLTYALMVIGTFAVIALMSGEGIACELCDDYRGLSTRHPRLALVMLILFFSLAGIPPTVGFVAKFGLLQALIAVHLTWLAWLALFFAFIGAYYYLRIIVLMYCAEPTTTALQTPIILPRSMEWALGLNSGAVLVLGIVPNALIELCRVINV